MIYCYYLDFQYFTTTIMNPRLIILGRLIIFLSRFYP